MDAVLEILELTQKSLLEKDPEIAKIVEPLEDTIDILTKECKNHHIQRLQVGNCTLELGFIFNDCLQNMERVADHCSNLAISVLEAVTPSVHAHDHMKNIKEAGNEQYQTLLSDFTNKYYTQLKNEVL